MCTNGLALFVYRMLLSDTIVASLAENGISTIRNDAVKLSFNDEHFYLIGIDDVWNGRPNIYHGLQGVKKNP